MISILLTIYNYNLFPLVQELHKQCEECEIDYEILTQDDASQSELNIENQKINSLSNCHFFVLDKNVGYRENRNLLAAKAKYKYLLFIDGDCKILNDNYINNYIENLKDFDAVYGGRLHPERCPSNNQKLRWKYGKYIEDKSAKNRKKTPFPSLLFNNTIIKKECFNAVKFDNSYKKYGHDDTQFSYQLFLKKAKINHIENPTEHNDIDSNAVYLEKMKGSLENLYDLFKENKIDKSYSKLISFFEVLKNLKATNIVSRFYKTFEKPIFKNLTGKNPSLLVYNLFRIGYLSTINTRKN